MQSRLAPCVVDELDIGFRRFPQPRRLLVVPNRAVVIQLVKLHEAADIVVVLILRRLANRFIQIINGPRVIAHLKFNHGAAVVTRAVFILRSETHVRVVVADGALVILRVLLGQGAVEIETRLFRLEADRLIVFTNGALIVLSRKHFERLPGMTFLAVATSRKQRQCQRAKNIQHSDHTDLKDLGYRWPFTNKCAAAVCC
jgi:hypothetical protein